MHAYLSRSPAPALPELHGQTTWASGSRPAPAAVARGRATAVVFLGNGCARCLEELRWTVRHLPVAERPAVVIAPRRRGGVVRRRSRPPAALARRPARLRANGLRVPVRAPFVQDDLSRLAASGRRRGCCVTMVGRPRRTTSSTSHIRAASYRARGTRSRNVPARSWHVNEKTRDLAGVGALERSRIAASRKRGPVPSWGRRTTAHECRTAARGSSQVTRRASRAAR